MEIKYKGQCNGNQVQGRLADLLSTALWMSGWSMLSSIKDMSSFKCPSGRDFAPPGKSDKQVAAKTASGKRCLFASACGPHVTHRLAISGQV